MKKGILRITKAMAVGSWLGYYILIKGVITLEDDKEIMVNFVPYPFDFHMSAFWQMKEREIHGEGLEHSMLSDDFPSYFPGAERKAELKALQYRDLLAEKLKDGTLLVKRPLWKEFLGLCPKDRFVDLTIWGIGKKFEYEERRSVPASFATTSISFGEVNIAVELMSYDEYFELFPEEWHQFIKSLLREGLLVELNKGK